jgi:DNA-binding MarR family transcriptional regulator
MDYLEHRHPGAPLAEDLRRAIGSFVRVVRKGADSAKSAQEETLTLLDQHGAMNIATLAQLRGVKHQTMRLVAAQLDAAALVQRRPDPIDRRSQLLSLSKKGQKEIAYRRNLRAATIDTMIRTTLSVKELKVLRAAVALLDRLTASIDV